MRPDADPNLPRPNSSEFKPWNIYPAPPEPHWHWTNPSEAVLKDKHLTPANEGFEFGSCEIPGADDKTWEFKIDERGVYQVYDHEPGRLFFISDTFFFDAENHLVQDSKPLFDIPTLRDYFVDLDFVISVISDGPTKSVAYRRLKYLASKYDMYSLLNEHNETAEMKVSARTGHSLDCIFTR
jgi:AMP deaminase